MHDNAKGISPVIASDATVPLEDASFLRAVLEAIPAFVVRLDAEQRISYINHLRSGVTLRDVIGQPCRELVAPGDRVRYEAAVNQALRTGEPCAYVAKGSRPVVRGHSAHYDCHAVPIDDADGRRSVCILATDVTEHVARADALQQSEEKLRIAVEASGIGLWTWDVANDHLECDQRLIHILGCEPRSTAEYLSRVVHPDDRERLSRANENARGGRPSFAEHRIVRPDGQVRWILPCGRIMKDEEGDALRMTGGILDVTAQRAIDEQLRRAQRLDAVGSLTAGIAHNFNNMLAVVLPALELCMSHGIDSQTQVLKDALHAAHRAKELVAQLMAFAGGKLPISAVPQDLAALVERIVAMCSRTFDRRVQIECVVDARVASVTCDATAIEQVLLNLLINARDAVLDAERAEPRVVVDLCEVHVAPPHAPDGAPRSYARIRVEDNGVGITDSVKQHLFEPFFTTKEPGKGTGLGLATSYGIMRDHGGFITLEPRDGGGTTAAVFLPTEQARAVSPRVASQSSTTARPSRILVIDDEAAVRRVVEVVLKERGHEVHLAADGISAVKAIDAGLVPDLILLDRSLPGWPVSVTLHELRRRTEGVPILFFTGQPVPTDECSQVEDVLYKPLSTDDLVRSVEQWLAPGA